MLDEHGTNAELPGELQPDERMQVKARVDHHVIDALIADVAQALREKRAGFGTGKRPPSKPDPGSLTTVTPARGSSKSFAPAAPATTTTTSLPASASAYVRFCVYFSTPPRSERREPRRCSMSCLMKP